MKYKEIVYMILDEIKGKSNDFSFNENHVITLCNTYRAFLLKQRYSTDIKKQIVESNYQTVCIDLMEVPAISGEPCEGGYYLRSKSKIPNLMTFSNTKVYPIDFFQGNIAFISRNRMKNVGFNKWMQNILYCSLGPDNFLYFKSSNPQHLYLEKVRLTGIFEDVEKAMDLSCDDNNECDILDKEFPIEASLISPLIELVVKELRASEYLPSDEINNANDDLDEQKVSK